MEHQDFRQQIHLGRNKIESYLRCVVGMGTHYDTHYDRKFIQRSNLMSLLRDTHYDIYHEISRSDYFNCSTETKLGNANMYPDP